MTYNFSVYHKTHGSQDFIPIDYDRTNISDWYYTRGFWWDGGILKMWCPNKILWRSI